MGVNNIRLKVAEIPSEESDGFQKLQRAPCLIEGEMRDFELAQQWFMTSAGRSDHNHMTLLDLSRSQVDGCIDDAVAKVCHVVRYM
jgi:hypothetical protein